MNEFRVTDQGELDLGLAAPATGPRPVARPPRGRMTAAAACPPGARPSPTDDGPGNDWPADDLLADWDFEPGDDGDPETDPDDYQAWLAGLPAAVRADYLAGAWTGKGESIPAGFLHHLRAGPSGAGSRRRWSWTPSPPARGSRRAHHRHRHRDRRHGQLGEVGADRGGVRRRRSGSWAAAARPPLTLAGAARHVRPVRPGRGRPSTSPTRSPPR